VDWVDPARQWLTCIAISLAASAVTYWGVGGAVHLWFYRRARDRAAEWKLQPKRWPSPELSRRAFLLGSANLVVGSIFGGTFLWYLQRGGWSTLYVDARRFGVPWLAVSGVVALAMIDAGLYYSHRLLHEPLLFRHVHRLHHKFLAPTIFTTTAMHPVEFVIFVIALLVPAFVVPMHVAVYGIVIGYTYLVGMIDHAGIQVRWKLPFHEDNRFHDDHHVYFHCNYGHHTTLFDRLHDTVRRPDRRYDERTFGGHGAVRDPK
jgi:lathosterol oxidase